MSIPNQALANLLQEIKIQAAQAQQQIDLVQSQIRSKQREIRMLDLTSKEVTSLPPSTNVYQGVGKMFVYSPIQSLSQGLICEMNDLKIDVENLQKKLHYLETTYKNSREHINQILKNGGQ
ncbi:putative prefoldin subunit [Erysiphe necator]|nr:putative prefoldin subunit [Erysiphe necator]